MTRKLFLDSDLLCQPEREYALHGIGDDEGQNALRGCGNEARKPDSGCENIPQCAEKVAHKHTDRHPGDFTRRGVFSRGQQPVNKRRAEESRDISACRTDKHPKSAAEPPVRSNMTLMPPRNPEKTGTPMAPSRMYTATAVVPSLPPSMPRAAKTPKVWSVKDMNGSGMGIVMNAHTAMSAAKSAM